MLMATTNDMKSQSPNTATSPRAVRSRWIRRRRTWPLFLLSLSTLVVRGTETNAPSARPGRAVTYSHEQLPQGPWSVHVVRIDRSNPNVQLDTTLARGNAFGLAVLTEHIKTVPRETGTPLAAINGDYFRDKRTYIGDPKGLQIMRGELVSAPGEWSCLWIDGAGNPHAEKLASLLQVTWPNGIVTPFGLNEERANNSAVLYTSAVGPSTRTSGGTELILESDGPWLPLRAGIAFNARVRSVREGGNAPLSADAMILSLGRQLVSRLPKLVPGMTLKLSTALSADLKGTQTAIGGGPVLLRNHQLPHFEGAEVRHPRSAIGWNTNYYFLVEVDGRQRALSVGMTLPELASYMAKLGCDEAMNLDGGGSATLWAYGQVMNSPSEGRQRGMANALVVVQREKK
jgi:phosphodiester glycosidase